MLWTILGAVVLGTILGILGRLIVPGEQKIPWWLTILIGIAAAFVGGAIYQWLGGGETGGIDWIKFIVQVAVAALFVLLVASVWSRRGRRASS
ncbi:MAG: GlsB/YeaQ/YmgE family stress response membrane protein [Micromonosporaceae bacterium]